MRPNQQQRRWLKKYLPDDFKDLHIIPRAYCVAKPSMGSAVFTFPHSDMGKMFTNSDNSGVVIDTENISSHIMPDVLREHVFDTCQGDWKTLVLARRGNLPFTWYCMPTLAPIK